MNLAEGSAILVGSSMIDKAIKDMKARKAPGPSVVTGKMLEISHKIKYGIVTPIANQVVQEGDLIVSCYKVTGETLDRSNYRGIKLLDQVMKVVERVIAQLIRNKIRLDEV